MCTSNFFQIFSHKNFSICILIPGNHTSASYRTGAISIIAVILNPQWLG